MHAKVLERSCGRKVRCKDAGLGVDGLAKLFLRAFEALGGSARTHRIHAVEALLGSLRGIEEGLAHAGLLRALACKQECYASHFVAPLSVSSQPCMRSSTISAADCSFFTMPATSPHMKEPSS